MRSAFIALLVSLAMSVPTYAAPRLKDKPAAYVPQTWVDVLVNAPATDLPWMELDRAVKEMGRAGWMPIGQELAGRINDRFERLGMERVPTLFDDPKDRGELTVCHVAGLLFHAKWIEAHGGSPKVRDFSPTTAFWYSGKVK